MDDKNISLNEKVKWDTILTKPFSLNKEIKLYHVSDVKDPNGIVYPLRKTVGNKLSKDYYCSWWAEYPNYGLLVMWFCKGSKCYDKNPPLGLPDCRDNWCCSHDGGEPIQFVRKSYYDKHKSDYNKFVCYEYSHTFKVHELGRGQEYALNEWTYDKEVKCESVKKIDFDDCLRSGQVVLLNDEEFDIKKAIYEENIRKGRKSSSDFRKKPWIYYPYSKVKELTYRLINTPDFLNPKYFDKDGNFIHEEYDDLFNVAINESVSLESLVKRPREFFKKIHLWRVSEFDTPTIKPYSFNVGTRLSSGRFSSFWVSSEKDWAIFYGLRVLLTGMTMEKMGINSEDLSNNTNKCRKRMVSDYRFDYENKFFINTASITEDEVKVRCDTHPIFLYGKKVRGYETGLGWHNPEEYTIDKEVSFDSKEKIKYDDFKKFIVYLTPEKYSEKYEERQNKKDPSGKKYDEGIGFPYFDNPRKVGEERIIKYFNKMIKSASYEKDTLIRDRLMQELADQYKLLNGYAFRLMKIEKDSIQIPDEYEYLFESSRSNESYENLFEAAIQEIDNKKMKINIWGRDFSLDVVYDCYRGEKITPQQVKSINNFSRNPNWVEKSKKDVIKFCSKDVKNDNENQKKDNIFSYIKPEAIFVKRDDKKSRVALMCKYRYDVEHGLAIVFDGNGNVTVGIQDIIL